MHAWAFFLCRREDYIHARAILRQPFLAFAFDKEDNGKEDNGEEEQEVK